MEKANKRGKKEQSSYEFRIISKGGEERIVEANTVNIGKKREAKEMGILRDITERKKEEVQA
jgi:PAS domain S-box-containing protein